MAKHPQHSILFYHLTLVKEIEMPSCKHLAYHLIIDNNYHKKDMNANYHFFEKIDRKTGKDKRPMKTKTRLFYRDFVESSWKGQMKVQLDFFMIIQK